jgi:hypothetical protein
MCLASAHPNAAWHCNHSRNRDFPRLKGKRWHQTTGFKPTQQPPEPTMHQERTFSVFDLFAAHEIGRDLKQRRKSLDEHSDLLGLVAEDLRRHGAKQVGPARPGGGAATSPVELPCRDAYASSGPCDAGDKRFFSVSGDLNLSIGRMRDAELDEKELNKDHRAIDRLTGISALRSMVTIWSAEKVSLTRPSFCTCLP